MKRAVSEPRQLCQVFSVLTLYLRDLHLSPYHPVLQDSGQGEWPHGNDITPHILLSPRLLFCLALHFFEAVKNSRCEPIHVCVIITFFSKRSWVGQVSRVENQELLFLPSLQILRLADTIFERLVLLL